MIGADGMITEDWKLGLYGGYSGSSARTDREKVESDNYHVGIYGGREWGAFSFRAGVGYTFSGLDTSRAVTNLNQRLTADYDADTLNLFGEFGYKTALGDTMLEPFVNFAHVSVKSDGFAETGGSAALTVDGQSTDTTTSTLGLRAARVVAVGESTAKIRGMIGWQHAFGNTASRSTARFLTGDDFTISNAPLDENALVVEAGMDFNLTTNATLGLSYRGRIGADARDHMANANLKVAS